MTEFNSVKSIGYTLDFDKKPTSRELLLGIDNDLYLIRVASSAYINEVDERNKRLPEDLKIDDNLFPLNDADLITAESVCKKLANLPLSAIQPYLIKENPIDEDTTPDAL